MSLGILFRRLQKTRSTIRVRRYLLKEFVKNLIKRSIQFFMRIFSSTRLGGFIGEIVIKDVMSRTQIVVHNDTTLQLTIPNKMNRYRADSFSLKEPETLEWLDNLPESCTLWDIGANVGLYSVYAAKKNNCNVVAFEPSVFNLECLARNLFINEVQNQIVIMPFALNDNLGTSFMHIGTTEWGGALSTFDKDVGWDGKSIKEVFSYQTFGVSLDKVVSILDIPPPDYIKMDVDGIEHFILGGGLRVLADVKGILIEINDDFLEQSEKSRMILENAGLKMVSKRHTESLEGTNFQNTYNQIWCR